MNKYTVYKSKLKNYIDDISQIKALSIDVEKYYFSLLKMNIDENRKNIIEELLIKNYLKYIIKIVINYIHQDYEFFDDLMIAGINGCLSAINNFDCEKNYRFLSYATIWIEGEIIKEIKRNQDNRIDYNMDESILDNFSYDNDNCEKIFDYKNINLDELLDRALSSKERFIIKSLYGYKCKKLTLEQIGLMYHVTKQAIYKIKKRTLYKLKESLK